MASVVAEYRRTEPEPSWVGVLGNGCGNKRRVTQKDRATWSAKVWVLCQH